MQARPGGPGYTVFGAYFKLYRASRLSFCYPWQPLYSRVWIRAQNVNGWSFGKVIRTMVRYGPGLRVSGVLLGGCRLRYTWIGGILDDLIDLSRSVLNISHRKIECFAGARQLFLLFSALVDSIRLYMYVLFCITVVYVRI